MKLETLLLTRLQVIFHFCKRFGVFRPTLKLLDESRDSTLQPEYLAIVKSRPGGKKHRVPEKKNVASELDFALPWVFHSSSGSLSCVLIVQF